MTIGQFIIFACVSPFLANADFFHHFGNKTACLSVKDDKNEPTLQLSDCSGKSGWKVQMGYLVFADAISRDGTGLYLGWSLIGPQKMQLSVVSEGSGALKDGEIDSSGYWVFKGPQNDDYCASSMTCGSGGVSVALALMDGKVKECTQPTLKFGSDSCFGLPKSSSRQFLSSASSSSSSSGSCCMAGWSRETKA